MHLQTCSKAPSGQGCSWQVTGSAGTQAQVIIASRVVYPCVYPCGLRNWPRVPRILQGAQVLSWVFGDLKARFLLSVRGVIGLRKTID